MDKAFQRYGERVRVRAQEKDGITYFPGTIARELNDGEIIEVIIEGNDHATRLHAEDVEPMPKQQSGYVDVSWEFAYDQAYKLQNSIRVF